MANTPNNDNLNWLYDTLTSKGVDLGSIEETAQAIRYDEDSRHWLYDEGLRQGIDMGSYDEYEQAMGLPKFQAPLKYGEEFERVEATSKPIATEQTADTKSDNKAEEVAPPTYLSRDVVEEGTPEVGLLYTPGYQTEETEAEEEQYELDKDVLKSYVPEFKSEIKQKYPHARLAGFARPVQLGGPGMSYVGEDAFLKIEDRQRKSELDEQLKLGQITKQLYEKEVKAINQQAIDRYNEQFSEDTINASAALHLMSNAQNRIKTVESRTNSKVGNFFRGLKYADYAGVNPALQLVDAYASFSVLNKLANNPDAELSESEEYLLQAIVTNNAVDDTFQTNMAERLGAGLPQNLAYMAQFSLTGGVGGAAGAAAKKGAQWAIKKGLKNAERRLYAKGFKGLLQKGADRALNTVIPGVVGASAAAAAQTALDPAGVASETMTRMAGTPEYAMEGGIPIATGEISGRKEFGEAYKEAFLTKFSENLSERSGESLGVLLGAGKAVGKATVESVDAVRKAADKVADLTDAVRNTKIGGLISQAASWLENKDLGLAQVADAVGWNGTVEEFYEEQVNTVLNAMLVGEEDLSALFDSERQLETILSVGIVGGSMRLVSAPVNMAQRVEVRREKQNLKRTIANIEKAHSSQAEREALAAIASAVDNGTVTDVASALAEINRQGHIDKNTAQDYLNYATGQMMLSMWRSNDQRQASEMTSEIYAEAEARTHKQSGAIVVAEYTDENGNKQNVDVVDGVIIRDGARIDGTLSDRSVVIRMQDGTTKMVSSKQLSDVEEEISPEIYRNNLLRERTAGLATNFTTEYNSSMNRHGVHYYEDGSLDYYNATPAQIALSLIDERGSVDEALAYAQQNASGLQEAAMASAEGGDGVTIEAHNMASKWGAVADLLGQMQVRVTATGGVVTPEVTSDAEDAAAVGNNLRPGDRVRLTVDNGEVVDATIGARTSDGKLIVDFDEVVTVAGNKSQSMELTPEVVSAMTFVEEIQEGEESLEAEEDTEQDDVTANADYAISRIPMSDNGRNWEAAKPVDAAAAKVAEYNGDFDAAAAFAQQMVDSITAGIDKLAAAPLTAEDPTNADSVAAADNTRVEQLATMSEKAAFWAEVAENINAAKAEFQASQGGTTTETATAEVEPSQTAESMPTREDGEPDFISAGVERTSQFLSEELGEDAAGFVQDNIAEAQKMLDEATSKKATSTNFTQRKQEAAVIAEERAAAQTLINFWNAVAEVYSALLPEDRENIAQEKNGVSEKNANFVDDNSERYGEGSEQNNDEQREADGGRLAGDATRKTSRENNRGDIRVFEEGLAPEYTSYSVDSERTRREKESERLVTIAKQNGLFIPIDQTKTLGEKYPQRTGESVVYFNEQQGRVFKVKNPYAKSAMKKGVQPEDVIFEHIIHNLLFPESAYTFEGISEDLGEVRIVLSQKFIDTDNNQPTREQIEKALSARGLFAEDKYTFGNEFVSVTDVEGDNAILDADGIVYFIDPIISFKKPVREIIDALSQGQQFANSAIISEDVTSEQTQEDVTTDDVASEQVTEEEITVEMIENSLLDETVKLGAIDYLNGNVNVATQLAYEIAKEYVRNNPQKRASDSTDAERAQLGKGTDDAGTLAGEQSRGDGRELDTQEDGGVVSDSDGVRSEAGQDDLAQPSGSRGDTEMGSAEPSSNDVPSSGSDGSSRGDRDSEQGSSVRAPRGRKRSSDGLPSQNENVRGEARRANDSGDSNTRSVGEKKADDLIAEGLQELKDILANPMGEAKGTLLDVTSLIGMFGANAIKIMGASAKIGIGLIQKGYYKFKKWGAMMHQQLDDVFHNYTQLTDALIDEFINAMWDYPFKFRGEVRKISEWASLLEAEELRAMMRMSIEEKRKLQKDAEGEPTILGDIDNIRKSLPFLLPAQQEDVEKAEVQFFDDSHKDAAFGYGKGYMFTNGTGTGKTYTGLGIIKRFIKQGKGRILIVTASGEKIDDWVKDAKNLGITATRLEDTKSKGKGVVVTQFANLRQNYALLKDEFDLVVYDESHKLMENQSGIDTKAAEVHYMVTNRDAEQAILRTLQDHPYWVEPRALETEYKEIDSLLKADKLTSEQLKRAQELGGREMMVQRLAQIDARLKELVKLQEAEVQKRMQDPEIKAAADAAVARTKTVFLSATPFNTALNLDYVEGYVFSYPTLEGAQRDREKDKERFLMDKFPSSHQRGKNGGVSRIPEGNIKDPEAVTAEEIAFSDYLQDSLHTMSGRALDSEWDYSREFPQLDVPGARLVNEAISALRGKYAALAPFFKHLLEDYAQSTAFFEVIKTSASIERIKEHIALGRKVVVFHRRMSSQEPLEPPFEKGLYAAGFDDSVSAHAINAFKKEFAELLRWEQTLDYRFPQDILLEAFATPEEKAAYKKEKAEYENKLMQFALGVEKKKPKQPKLKSAYVGVFNGKESEAEKHNAVERFNTDGSKCSLLVVQVAAGKEGISLHDRTGKHQRVMMSMQLPESPIEFVQAEGRIYRVGNQSNAIFEYPMLGIDQEVIGFAAKINGRAATTENLALGSRARGLRNSISRAVLASRPIPVAPTQGVGGKQLDSRAEQNKTSYDEAIAEYNSLSAQRTTTDFNEQDTPEPIGFKMMEWARAEAGESVLEPAAGTGVMAQYAPQKSRLTAIETLTHKFAILITKLGGSGRKLLNETFMAFDKHNKFDCIVMNSPHTGAPMLNALIAPAGVPQKEFEFLDKAFGHINEGGRVVALLADKSADATINAITSMGRNRVVVGEVKLPAFAFPNENGGTATRVVIFDVVSNEDLRKTMPAKVSFDLSGQANAQALFEALRNVQMPERTIDKVAVLAKKLQKFESKFKEFKNLISKSKNYRSGKMEQDITFAPDRAYLWVKTSHGGKYRVGVGGYYFNLNISGEAIVKGDMGEIKRLCATHQNIQKILDASTDDEFRRLTANYYPETYDEIREFLKVSQDAIRTALGKTDSQIKNIAEGRVENELRGELTFKQMRDAFQGLSHGDVTLEDLSKKVFEAVGKIDGLRFYTKSGMNPHTVAYYDPRENSIVINEDTWNSLRYSDGFKAQTVVHEMIHAVTSYYLRQFEMGLPLSAEISKACSDINEVYQAITADDSFRNALRLNSKLGDNAEYGLTSVYEMIAELANPVFRAQLKLKKLWRQLIEGIQRLLGINLKGDSAAETTALEVLENALDTLMSNFDSQVYKQYTNLARDFSDSMEFVDFTIRTSDPPVKTGIGYKVFVLKEGKLYPPKVANPGGEDTPVGVWLDADEGERAEDSKTGRPQVKSGGKGTDGGSGNLAYRPGWHLGEIPYALQFNRNDENGVRSLFPANFVWAEVEYADDIDYQEEAMSYGYNKNGKFQHSYAGLPRIPENGSYRYRTNPNPQTDPWVITGAMRVRRLLTPTEVDEIVKAAGREPQVRQNGAITDADINALNEQLGLEPIADYGMAKLDQDDNTAVNETTPSERSGADAGNSSSEGLLDGGNVHLSRQSFTRQQDATNITKNTVNTKQSLSRIIREGGFVGTIKTPQQAVRALGKGLKLKKASGSLSYYGDLYEGEFEVDNTHLRLRISTHPANEAKFGNVDADHKVSVVILKNGEHQDIGEHKGYEEYVYDPNHISPEGAANAVLSGVAKLLETGEYGNESGVAEKKVYPTYETGRVMYRKKTATDSQQAIAAQAMTLSTEEVEKYAKSLAEVAPEGVRIVVTNSSESGNTESLGWYDMTTDTVYINADMCANTAGVDATFVHELVGHRSMPSAIRRLIGTRNAADRNKLYTKLFALLPEDYKSRVATKQIAGMDLGEAVDEALAEAVENEGAIEPSVWKQICAAVRALWRRIFNRNLSMSDNDIKYMFWLSAHNLDNPAEFTASGQVRNRLRKKPVEITSKATTAEQREYDEKVALGTQKFVEAWVDSLNPLKKLQEVVSEKHGELKSFENAYDVELGRASRTMARSQMMSERFLKPVLNAVSALINNGYTLKGVTNYMIAKHGLERNDYYRREELRKLNEDINKFIQEVATSETYKDLSEAEKIAVVKSQFADYLGFMNADEIKSALEWYAKNDDPYMGAVITYIEAIPMKDRAGLTGLAESLGADDADTAFTEFAENLVAEFEGRSIAAVDTLWDAVRDMTNATLLYQVEGGIISKEQYAHLRSMYRYYIPLRGWDGLNSSDIYDYSISPARHQSIVKSAEGRTSLADDPLANMANMLESSVAIVEQNASKQALVRMAMNRPDSSLLRLVRLRYEKDQDPNTGKTVWKVVYPDIQADASSEEVDAAIEGYNAVTKQMVKEGKARVRRSQIDVGVRVLPRNKNDHYVTAMFGGEEVAVIINGNPAAARALNGTNAPEYDKALQQSLGWATRQYAKAHTTWSPRFVLTNFMRDYGYGSFSSFVRHGGRYALNFQRNVCRAAWFLPKMLANGTSTLTTDQYEDFSQIDNETLRYFIEFLTNGGETGFSRSLSTEEWKKEIANQLEELQGTNPKNVVKALAGLLAGMNRWAEDIPRFAAYLTSCEMGKNVADSIKDAKEITVNFSRHGSGQYGNSLIRQTFAFVNAGIQGSYNFFVTLAKENPQRFWPTIGAVFMSGFALPFINGLLLAAFGDDDDKRNYQYMSQFNKTNRLVIFNPFGEEKGFLTIPIAHELIPAYALGNIAHRRIGNIWWNAEDPQDVEVSVAQEVAGALIAAVPLDFISSSANGVSWRSFVPSVAQPIYDVFANKDFQGRQIYRSYDFGNGNTNRWDAAFTKAPIETWDWLVELSRGMSRITGGDGLIKPGLADFHISGKDADVQINNPAIAQYLLESYLGGAVQETTRVGNLIKGVIARSRGNENEAERYLASYNIPILSGLYRASTEKSADGRIDDIYDHYKEDIAKQCEREYRAYMKELPTDVEKWSDYAREALSSEEFKIYKLYESADKTVREAEKALRKLRDKNAPKATIDSLKEKIRAVKLEVIEEASDIRLRAGASLLNDNN